MRYRRVIIPEVTYFPTVNLNNRKRTLLIDYIDLLRASFRHAKHHYSFTIDAVVILPDHSHNYDFKLVRQRWLRTFSA